MATVKVTIMLVYIADLLAKNIETITARVAVTDFVSSDRTQIHKQLLTAEIVNGMKALLSNLAEALAEQGSMGQSGRHGAT